MSGSIKIVVVFVFLDGVLRHVVSYAQREHQCALCPNISTPVFLRFFCSFPCVCCGGAPKCSSKCNPCPTPGCCCLSCPSEIVLLDFHRFPGLGHGPPHEKAANVVLETLRDVMILPKFRNQPFDKLMDQPGRVAVLWNAVEVRTPRYGYGWF